MTALLDPIQTAFQRSEASLFENIDKAITLISATWMETHEVWPKYTTDLGLEALLACYDATGSVSCLRHVERVWAYRHPPVESLTAGNSYFTCLHYETYLRTGDPRYVQGLVELADNWIHHAPRNKAGAIGHRSKPHGAIFLDLFGGLVPLLARAGSLSGNSKYFDECISQIRLYREALFDPVRGLWHHALDWHLPGSLAPAGWCRGGGWVLRGLEKSLLALPNDHPGREAVWTALLDTLRGLLARQNPDGGLWHQLVQHSGSPLETSGSGFILATLASPVLQECSSEKLPFDLRLRLGAGIRGLLKHVDRNGCVRDGCPECPPLLSEKDYLQIPMCEGDPHAMAGALLAFAGARNARNKGWL